MKNTYIIHKNVELGKNADIEDFAIIGIANKNSKKNTKIGKYAKIRSHTVVYAGNVIGNNFQTGHNVLIRENNVIGDYVSVGSHTVIERENKIGNNVRIHSSCFIPEYVKIENRVWLSPCVTIVNIFHPPCPEFEKCVAPPVIEKGAKIGANTTILPGVTIGKGAFIGAGSVVTKDVPDKMVAYGNPAKILKKVDDLECRLGVFKYPYKWEEKGWIKK